MGRESLVEYLEQAPLSGFHYGVLTICSLAYALTGMGVMLISILLSPIKAEWGLDLVTTALLASVGYVGMFFGAIVCRFLLDRLGRKPVLIGYLALAGVGSYLLGFARDVNSILVWSCVISFFNLGAWAGLYTYTLELYPTRMRGSGSGVAASLGRFAGIFAPTVTPLLWVSAEGLWLPFIVFALAHGAAALSVVVLGIETKFRFLDE